MRITSSKASGGARILSDAGQLRIAACPLRTLHWARLLGHILCHLFLFHRFASEGGKEGGGACLLTKKQPRTAVYAALTAPAGGAAELAVTPY